MTGNSNINTAPVQYVVWHPGRGETLGTGRTVSAHSSFAARKAEAERRGVPVHELASRLVMVGRGGK